jgi:hypothetical protein
MIQTLLRNVEEARRAYWFSPGSYTHAAFVSALAAYEKATAPTWIDEFLTWNMP